MSSEIGVTECKALALIYRWVSLQVLVGGAGLCCSFLKPICTYVTISELFECYFFFPPGINFHIFSVETRQHKGHLFNQIFYY